MRRRKKQLKYLLAFAAAALCIAAALFIGSRLEALLTKVPEGAETAASIEARQTTDPGEAADDAPDDVPDDGEPVRMITYDGKKYRYNDDLSALLILGIDDRAVSQEEIDAKNSQADFLALAVFDPASRSVTVIQLNRDTMMNTPVPDENGEVRALAYQQLALAHNYGSTPEESCENTALAVSMLLYDIDVDNYFALTMDAIPILNDLVGGVTVTIEDDFTGVEDAFVLGSEVTLRGSQAETFVRSRMDMPDDATNIARMRRQRTYMTALSDALRKAVAGDSAFVLEAFGAITDYLVTDCSVDQLLDYAQRLSGYTLRDIITPEGESVEGERFMEYYVNEEALQKLVIDMFYLPMEE